MKKNKKFFEDVAMKIALFIGFVFYALVLFILLPDNEGTVMKIVTGICVLVATVTLMFTSYFIMKSAYLVYGEDIKKKKTYLRKDGFIDVEFIGTYDDSGIAIRILQEFGELSFSAKIDENNTILVVAKNTNGNEISRFSLVSFIDFDKNFIKKE